jgi:hypothetical protein
MARRRLVPQSAAAGGPIIPRHLLLTDGLSVHEAAALKAGAGPSMVSP